MLSVDIRKIQNVTITRPRDLVVEVEASVLLDSKLVGKINAVVMDYWRAHYFGYLPSEVTSDYGGDLQQAWFYVRFDDEGCGHSEASESEYPEIDARAELDDFCSISQLVVLRSCQFSEILEPRRLAVMHTFISSFPGEGFVLAPVRGEFQDLARKRLGFESLGPPRNYRDIFGPDAPWWRVLATTVQDDFTLEDYPRSDPSCPSLTS